MPDKPVDTNLFMPMVKEDWKYLNYILFIFFENVKLSVKDTNDRKRIVFAHELKEMVESKLEEIKEEENE